MKLKKILLFATILACFTGLAVACGSSNEDKNPIVVPTEMTTETTTETATMDSTEATTIEASPENIVYENEKYGFNFNLPLNWEGYLVLEETWTGTSIAASAVGELTGPKIILRHPNWTEAKPMQDIPILIFTTVQWQALLDEKYSVSAAPIPPSMLDENNVYVFALPARYNFEFLEGYEAVETILSDEPLEAFDVAE